ncbi:LAGLIDADG family homing endonuclease [Candidatus Parcubacteria bacterium]|nr:LAGLIDADG family homing endonuclease [Candidatus Parcubacteria bacterium]
MSQQWLKQIPPHIGWYLAGFADGEGSFNVSLKRDPEYQVRWHIEPSFNVSQRDMKVLVLMKRYLGVGTLRSRKDGVVYYEVRNYRALHEQVIPFFKKFRFFSETKQRNFSLFAQIVDLMIDGRHTTREGLEDILTLREKLNPGRGRKRKYSMDDYAAHKRNPQRLYARPLDKLRALASGEAKG